MADSFTKLFSSILASTVWQESDTTRLTWIAMLAMADQNGHVIATVPGLAHFARVSLPDCEAALERFLAPDRYSRTPDQDGRRIEPVPGGWALLNHALYRAKRSDEARKEYQRKWDRQNRKRSDNPTSDVSDSDNGPTPEQANPTQAEAEAEAVKEKATVQPAAAQPDPVPDKKPAKTSREFPRFWAAYPVKKGKAAAEKHWKAQGLDPMADAIIAHVRRMEAEDDQWQRGFIPHGSTYINGKGWQDEPARAPIDGKAPAKAPAPETFGPAAAMASAESPLEAALAHAKRQYQLGQFGTKEDGLAKYQAECGRITAKYRGQS